MRKVAVIGGSSGVGLEAVKSGLAAGYRVRAFARRAASISIDSEALEKIEGDALDPSSVRRAVAGVDAVIVCLGVPMNLKLLTGPITLFSTATTNVLNAMVQEGVDRLVAVTGFGAGGSEPRISRWQRPAFNVLFGRAYADKSLQEELIQRSNLDWIIARPGVLTNGPKKNYRVLSAPENWRNGVISRASVADFLIRQVDPIALSGQSPVLIHK